MAQRMATLRAWEFDNIPMPSRRAPAEVFCQDRPDLLMRTRASLRVWLGAVFGEAF